MPQSDDDAKQGFGLFRAVRTVLSAFIGIRRSESSKNDLAKLSPVQIIVTGVICAVVLMGCLLLLVRQITH